MDDQTVRPYAEAHGAAVLAGDTAHVLADFDPDLHPRLGLVGAALPQPTTGAEVVSIEPGEQAAVVLIRYSGADSNTVVRSVWEDRGGRPLIVEVVPQ